MEHKSNGIMVKTCKRFEIFKQALSGVVLPLLPDCIVGMKTVSDGEYFPYYCKTEDM